MAVHYAGAERDCRFNNYDVTQTDDGWDKSAWFDVKPQFKEQNGLINLPYVIDNGFVVTQTNAVLMYLGRKFGLAGETPQQTSIVEQVLCQTMDLRNDTVRAAYGTGDLAAHLSSAPTHFAKLEQFLEQLGSTYYGGATPSVADFHVFEMVEQHQFMAAKAGVEGFLSELPRVAHLAACLKRDPRMASYFGSEEYGYPLNNKMAKYGATVDDGRPEDWRPVSWPMPPHLLALHPAEHYHHPANVRPFHGWPHAATAFPPVYGPRGYGLDSWKM